jgi:2-polyprenyl-3-methyl-5-hydroxy-6-metoxy-1,4-benzoquinol methylase
VNALERARSLIGRDRFADFEARYPSPSYAKYLDLDLWIPVNERRAKAIGLDDRRKRRVLDIGTGCGFFPFVCAGYGHEVVATDCARRPVIYREVTALLDVPVLDHDVQAFEHVPDFGTFDVITAFMVTLNGHCRTPWTADEWRFFIADMRSRLRPGGSIVIELNREPAPLDACYTPELRAAFVSMGADITGHWPHRYAADGHRLTFR